MGDRERFSVLK